MKTPKQKDSAMKLIKSFARLFRDGHNKLRCNKCGNLPSDCGRYCAGDISRRFLKDKT